MQAASAIKMTVNTVVIKRNGSASEVVHPSVSSTFHSTGKPVLCLPIGVRDRASQAAQIGEAAAGAPATGGVDGNEGIAVRRYGG